MSAIEPRLTADTTTASSVGSLGVLSPPPELEGTARVEGGSRGKEKMNGNMGVSTNQWEVGGGLNTYQDLPAP